MKCSHCGAELKDGSLFCSECGRKIEVQKQSFCQVCGHALSAGSKFCPECGASIPIPSAGDTSERLANESGAEPVVEPPKNQWTNGNSGEYHIPGSVPPYTQNSKSKDFFRKWKEKLLKKWKSLDTFLKIVTVALGLAILLLIIAVFSHRILASLISILQIAGLVIVTQMHKGKIKGTDTRSKNLVLGIMLAFFVLNFASRTISPIDTYRIRRAFESKSEKTTVSQQSSPDYDDLDEILAGLTEFGTTNTEVAQETTTASIEKTEAETESTTQHIAASGSAASESETTKPTTTKPVTTKSTTTKSTTKKATTTTEPETYYYSTNNKIAIKDGDTGVYAYKSRGGTYDIYYIIDFDQGYVYTFCDGNGDVTCDRLKIQSGNLNSVLIITYHDGEDKWSNGLHFKYKNIPNHLIMQDDDGFESDYYATNLKDTLKVRDKKQIKDY